MGQGMGVAIDADAAGRWGADGRDGGRAGLSRGRRSRGEGATSGSTASWARGEGGAGMGMSVTKRGGTRGQEQAQPVSRSRRPPKKRRRPGGYVSRRGGRSPARRSQPDRRLLARTSGKGKSEPDAVGSRQSRSCQVERKGPRTRSGPGREGRHSGWGPGLAAGAAGQRKTKERPRRGRGGCARSLGVRIARLGKGHRGCQDRPCEGRRKARQW